MIKKIILVFLIFSLPLIAQKTNRGKDFYIAFPPNFHDAPNKTDSLYIFISSQVQTSGNIIYRNYSGNLLNLPFQINDPNQVYTFAVQFYPFELIGDFNNISDQTSPNLLSQNGNISSQFFNVISNDDVTVVALNQAHFTTDAALIFPKNVLGTDYTIMSYNSDGRLLTKNSIDFSASTPSQFIILATEDSSIINIHTSVKSTPFQRQDFKNIVLNKGESYLIQANIFANDLNLDLTGSTVNSTKPIVVYSGHQRSLLPIRYSNQAQTYFLNSRDYLYEQILPNNVLGRRYFITPFAQANNVNIAFDQYRILAVDDSTLVQIGNYQKLLKKGQSIDRDLISAEYLESNKPVMLAEFKRSIADINGNNNSSSDPLMIIIPPAKQFLKEYTFINAQATDITVSNNLAYNLQYATIICPNSSISNFILDSFPLKNPKFLPIPNSCYSYSILKLTDGPHNIKCDKPFGLYVYGYGQTVSYGYLGGMSFDTIPENFPIAEGDTVICHGGIVKLRAKNGISYKWGPDSLVNCVYCDSQILSPNASTNYYIEMTDTIGCIYYDTLFVTVNSPPELFFAGNHQLCYGDSIQISVAGAKDIYWLDSDYVSCHDCAFTYIFPKQSMYFRVKGISSNKCEKIDSIFITVLKAKLSYKSSTTEICIGDTATLVVEGGVNYRWFPNQDIDITTGNQVKVFPKVDRNYYIEMIDNNNCKTIDSIFVKVNKLPNTFTSKDTSVCDGGFAIVSAFGGIKYKWFPNIGIDCDTCQTTNIIPDTTRYYKVKITNENGCSNFDSVKISTLICPIQAKIKGYTFPNLLLCDSIDGFVKISNIGSQELLIDSLFLDGENANSFEIINYKNLNLPKILTLNEVFRVPIRFAPKKEGTSNALIHAITSVDSIKLVDIVIGLSYKNKVQILVSPDTSSKPGDTISLLLSINNPNYLENRIHELELLLVFNSIDLRYLNQSSFLNNKNINPKSKVSLLDFYSLNQSAVKIDFLLDDNIFIDKNQDLVALDFLILLGDKLTLSTKPIANLMDRDRCILYDPISNKITLDLCLENLRFVDFSGFNYKFSLVDNILQQNQIKIEYSIGIDGTTDMSIYNSIGQELIRQTFETPKGDYNKLINLENLSNGSYFIKFNSGPFSSLKYFIINR